MANKMHVGSSRQKVPCADVWGEGHVTPLPVSASRNYLPEMTRVTLPQSRRLAGLAGSGVWNQSDLIRST